MKCRLLGKNLRAHLLGRRRLIGERLQIGRIEAVVLKTALVERMKTEKNSYSLAALGKALGSLSAKLEAMDLHGAEKSSRPEFSANFRLRV